MIEPSQRVLDIRTYALEQRRLRDLRRGASEASVDMVVGEKSRLTAHAGMCGRTNEQNTTMV